MAWSWSKSWSASDDGSVFGGSDLGTLQSDISSQALDLASDQTITGTKTFSTAPKVDTVAGKLKIKIAKITKTYSDFSAAVLTNTVNLIVLPANTLLIDAFAKLNTEFSGGAIASYYIQVGYATDVDAILDENDVVNGINVFTGAGTGFKCKAQNEKGADFGTFYTTSTIYASATTVQAKATVTVANLDQATAGSIDIYLVYAELD